MEWVYLVLKMLVLVIVILIVYNFMKVYLLDKVKINKWIVLALAVITFIAPVFFGEKSNMLGSWWQYLHSAIFVMLFLWYMDLAGFNKRTKSNNRYSKNDKNTVIKSKAKPSRIKNTSMEVIEKNKKKKLFKK
ncbi:hypothetical protein SH2C18_15950 [Clostridium sediminicola]|uniref:hypothetical protein n=1 Tax=Clostridium sediminicola TaxID=3114879 RepID=UPI0031F1E6C5